MLLIKHFHPCRLFFIVGLREFKPIWLNILQISFSGIALRIHTVLHRSRDHIDDVVHSAQLRFLASARVLPRVCHVHIEFLLPHIEYSPEQCDPCRVDRFVVIFMRAVLHRFSESSNIHHNCSCFSGTLLYIISFIPFIVTLTSEAVLSLGTKLMLCTSMSSAFCYGSLYITRCVFNKHDLIN